MLEQHFGNLLINGDFLPGLWSRVAAPVEGVECPVWRETFVADRWAVRYTKPEGAAITQGMTLDVPPHFGAACSLELRGAEGVTQPVLLGQRVDAAEAARYRKRLVFSAWLYVIGERKDEVEVGLRVGTARELNVFGGGLNDEVVERIGLPRGRWVHLEQAIDARAFSANGLSLELEFPAELLAQADAAIRIAGARLMEIGGGDVARPASVETFLARRFFQRYDSSRINSLGRALVVNTHELHFQFVFDEMRAFPACTLPHDEETLRVFNLEGIPQEGFAYDVTYRSRGSAIIRATKENHGLADGFLSFVGTGGAILLDAEL
jgi:hypothetical protein